MVRRSCRTVPGMSFFTRDGGVIPFRVAALSAAALLLAGCGGDDTQTGGGGTTTAPSETTTTTSEPTTTGPTTTRPPVSTTLRSVGTETPINASSFVPEGFAEFEQETINGVAYPNAMTIPTSTSPKKVEINAGRTRNRFLGALGVPDTESSASVHHVEISLDDAPPVFSTELKFGETKDIDLDVTNVLRIRITVLLTSRTPTYSSIAIGNPRFK